MSHYFTHPKIFDQSILLTKEEVVNPVLALDAFFEDYRLSEVRHFLWEMVETCLTTDNVSFNEPSQRADLLTRYTHMERLFEAASLMATSKVTTPPG